MKTYSQFVSESVDGGLYSFRNLNSQTSAFFDQWMRENQIPNSIPATQLHCTVVCSEVEIPGYAPDPTLVMVSPATYTIAIMNGALVVKFKSDPLEAQWQRAMNMGGKSRYPTFAPHITLSYKVPVEYDHSDLKPPPTFMVLNPEECRPLVNGWAALNHLREYTLGGGPGIFDKDDLYVPQHSLNIPRENMPQIADADKMAFVDWLEDQGIVVQFVNVPVAMLRSVQNGIDLKKVGALSNSLPQEALGKPVIISKEGFILDGHHRWLAILNRDPHFAIAAYRVNLPIQDLLTICKNYDQAYFTKRQRVPESINTL